MEINKTSKMEGTSKYSSNQLSNVHHNARFNEDSLIGLEYRIKKYCYDRKEYAKAFLKAEPNSEAQELAAIAIDHINYSLMQLLYIDSEELFTPSEDIAAEKLSNTEMEYSPINPPSK